jgi:hypothetical protein
MLTTSNPLNRLIHFLLFLHFFSCNDNSRPVSVAQVEQNAQPIKVAKSDSVPSNVKTLMRFYPDIVAFENNYLVMSNGEKILYDDHKQKSISELLDDPDVEDTFYWRYDSKSEKPRNKEDAGRIRNEKFLKTLYGNSQENVRKNLKSFVWCPKLVNQTVLFNKKNGAMEALKRVSDELDLHPEWKKYLSNIGGTFNWRNISGTNRLSAHSFGITIDINTGFSNYWQWDCDCKNEETDLVYKNRIPTELVKIFEKNGFIWGGRWYHYDTMHFEYRPEMIQ